MISAAFSPQNPNPIRPLLALSCSLPATLQTPKALDLASWRRRNDTFARITLPALANASCKCFLRDHLEYTCAYVHEVCSSELVQIFGRIKQVVGPSARIL